MKNFLEKIPDRHKNYFKKTNKKTSRYFFMIDVTLKIKFS